MIDALWNYTRVHFWKGDLETTLHEDLKSNDPSICKSHRGRKAMKTDLVETRRPLQNKRRLGRGTKIPRFQRLERGGGEKNHWPVDFCR